MGTGKMLAEAVALLKRFREVTDFTYNSLDMGLYKEICMFIKRAEEQLDAEKDSDGVETNRRISKREGRGLRY